MYSLWCASSEGTMYPCRLCSAIKVRKPASAADVLRGFMVAAVVQNSV